MRYFLRAAIPPFSRVLLVESGSRHLIERTIPVIYQIHGEATADLLTCYAGAPNGLGPGSTVYRVSDYPGAEGRSKLLAELIPNRYSIVGILCSAEPIMTKWKWWIAWKLPAKVFVVNENGDWFWVDRKHWRTIIRFAMYRAGLTGADAAATLARIAAFPFTLAYLLCYAGWIHLRRALRSAH